MKSNERGKAAFFKRSPWMAGIPRSVLAELVGRSTEHRIRRGRAIWDPSDASDRVFWVRSGVVRVERPAGDGERLLILRFHGRGDAFGVAALYSERDRGTRAVAHDECVIYGTPAEVVEDVARAHGDLGLRLSDLLIARQRSLESRLAGVVFHPVKERLLETLAELARDFGVRDSRGVILDIRLTHREMAALIGTTRETVSLTLVQLRRARWIETENRRVVLLRPADMGVVPRAGRRRV